MLVESSSTCQTSLLYMYLLSWLVSSSFWQCLPYIHKDIYLVFVCGGFKNKVGTVQWWWCFPERMCVTLGWRQHVTWSCFCQQLPSVRCSWCKGLEKAYEFFWPNLCWENELQVLCFTPSLLLSPFKAVLFVHFVRAVLRVDARVLWENVRAYNLFWLISIWIQREQVLSFGTGFGSGLII